MKSIEKRKVQRLQAMISKQSIKVNKDLHWKRKLDSATDKYSLRKQLEEQRVKEVDEKLLKLEE